MESHGGGGHPSGRLAVRCGFGRASDLYRPTTHEVDLYQMPSSGSAFEAAQRWRTTPGKSIAYRNDLFIVLPARSRTRRGNSRSRSSPLRDSGVFGAQRVSGIIKKYAVCKCAWMMAKKTSSAFGIRRNCPPVISCHARRHRRLAFLWPRSRWPALLASDGHKPRNSQGPETAWTFRTGDAYRPADGRPTAFEATPLYVDGTIFLGTPLGPSHRARPHNRQGALVLRSEDPKGQGLRRLRQPRRFHLGIRQRAAAYFYSDRRRSPDRPRRLEWKAMC